MHERFIRFPEFSESSPSLGETPRLSKNQRKILNLEESVNHYSPILYIRNDVAKALTSPGIPFSFDDALVE